MRANRLVSARSWSLLLRTSLLAAAVAALLASPAIAAPRAARVSTAASASATGWPFAPYVDMADWPVPDLRAIRTGSGARHISLGFVTAREGEACVPTWGGFRAYPAAGAGPYQLAQVKALRRAGGDVVVSFGGQAGTELASACVTRQALAHAYESVVAAYGAKHIDFDVEGDNLLDRKATARRTLAILDVLKHSSAQHRPLAVSFTLPVTPSGLDADGLAVVRDAASQAAPIGVVNGMAMDYGDDAAPKPAGRMGAYATQVGESLYGQLQAVFASLHRSSPRHYPSRTSAQVWRTVGVTPMLGINDVASEVFTLNDARQVAAWAGRRHIGMLGMWALGRDRQCPHATTTTQDHCSGVAQAPWAFARALGAFKG